MATRPPGTPDVDLTFDGATGTINGGVFMTGLYQLVPDQFSSFLEIRHNGTEEGYNTNGNLQFDERDVQNSTHAILLAEVPIIVGDGSRGTVEGVVYREFRLNIGEAGNAKQFLSLDGLQIWQEEAGNLTNFTPGSGFAGAHTNKLVYDLDADGVDRWIGLKEGLNGNGAVQTEFTILIPDELFINDPAHRYVTLYSEFGMQDGWESDSSSEVWGLSHASGGPVSAMTVQKTVTSVNGLPPVLPEGPSVDSAGDDIFYAITIANVGNTNLTGITVIDPVVSNLVLVSGDNGNGVLDVGETWHYTASYEVTQDDINTLGDGDGLIDNAVTADSAQTTPISATASVVVENGTSVDLVKTVTFVNGLPPVLPASVDSAGDMITYTITVTNDGNTTLTAPVVEDSNVNIVTPIYDLDAPILGPALLAPVLDGDYNVGDTNESGFQDPGETFQFKNAGDENGDGIENFDDVFLFTNVGDTNQNGGQDTGEVFQYAIIGFDVSHVATYVSGDDGDGEIDVGETWTYTTTYTVTQDDIDNGGVVNPALTHDNTATVTTSQGAADEESVSVSIVQDPRISLVKSAEVEDGVADEDGDVIDYTITVTNTGNMTLTDIDLSDTSVSGLTLSGDDGDGKLELGEIWVYSASHILTQAEIDNGGVVAAPGALTIDNTATVTTAQSEQNPDGDPDASASDSASIVIVQDPRITLTKSAVVADGTADEVGDVINYTINVANAGNMTLTGISVSEPAATGLTLMSGDDGDGKLELGETWVYNASHTITQDDIDNGGVVNPALTYDNTATVTTNQSEQDPDGDAEATASDLESVVIVQDPRISLVKSAVVADGDADEVGDVINYTVNVANAGNMTLTSISVIDLSVPGLAYVSGDAGNDGKLGMGEIWVYNGSHTITQDDLDAGGSITNTASVTTAQGTALPSPDPDANDSDTESVPIVQSPSIALDKAATVPGDTADTAGEVIDYTIDVTNTGNITLTGVSVVDAFVTDLAYFSGDDGNGLLDVNETWQYTATHTVTQAELDNNGGGDGVIQNTASVTTTQGATANDSASVTVVPPPPTVGISIDDNNFLSQLSDPGGDGPTVGDPIQFFFQITNLGNTMLTNVAVSDTLGDAVPGSLQTPIPSSLAGNAVFVDTFNHFLTAADITAGNVVDDITVTADDYLSAPQFATWHYDFDLFP